MSTYSRTGSHRVNGTTSFFTEHGYLVVPSLVQWMATLRCGLSCPHCLAVSYEAGFADMPLARAKALIDEVAAMGVSEFLITGGEPLARADLAEVIAYLDHRQVRWSLNTATLPNAPLREAIAHHQPGFVAVSLDGPRPVHDTFRGKSGAYNEAMEAIRFFKSLDGVRVCVGTTVTKRNYGHLDETFHLAVASGADQWGIHLLVPEGRAADRADLFLSKSQLQRLIKFVARKRRYFRVEMADEIGYLGYLEPLVRDRPLTCGAGRSQCVVLPDGSVVPCTTLDRSCSAGNINERALMDIWTEGFADIRAWQPTGKCGRCDYAIACKGGCWLQRKAGRQCFKEVWHVPGVLKTAAGIAICLGTLATGPNAGTTQAALPPESRPPSPPAARQVLAGEGIESQILDEAILNYYVELAAGLEMDSLFLSGDLDTNDPGVQFLLAFKEGTLPENMTECCALVYNALETEHRSLSLIALLWRAVSAPLFQATEIEVDDDGDVVLWGPNDDAPTDEQNAQEDLEEERQTIRDTLAAIKQTADAWRLEIFEGYLDPYLQNGRYTYNFLYSKRGPGPGDYAKYPLLKDLNAERWGLAPDPDWRRTEEGMQLERAAAEAYFLAHHHADQLDLRFTFPDVGELVVHSGGEETLASSHVDGTRTGRHTLDVFDVMVSREDVTLSFELTSDLRVEPARNDGEEALLSDDQDGGKDLKKTIEVTLEAGREYTYVQLLQAVYERHRDTLMLTACDWLRENTLSVGGEDIDIVAAVGQNGALLWPAFREMIETGGVFQVGEPGNIIDVQLTEEDVGRAILKDIDFWMF